MQFSFPMVYVTEFELSFRFINKIIINDDYLLFKKEQNKLESETTNENNAPSTSTCFTFLQQVLNFTTNVKTKNFQNISNKYSNKAHSN